MVKDKSDEKVVLSLDMQADFRRQIKQKRLGFNGLAKSCRRAGVTAEALVAWCQKTDPVVLKSDWEAVQHRLEGLAVRTDRKAPPNEDKIMFPARTSGKKPAKKRRAKNVVSSTAKRRTDASNSPAI